MVGDREVLDGYAANAMAQSGRGQVLAPWPNRLEDGAYEFDGMKQQLPLSEPATRTAIHGLVRWSPWACVARDDVSVELEHVLFPQPGYPFALRLQVAYRLDDDGLAVRTRAENVGDKVSPFGVGHHPYIAAPSGLVDDLVLRLPASTRFVTDDRYLPRSSEPVSGESDFREARPIGATIVDATFTDLERDDDGVVRVQVGDVTVWFDEAFEFVQVFTGDPLPDIARRSIAVEPMTCPPNAFRSGEGLIRLEPGETFEGRWGISVAPG